MPRPSHFLNKELNKILLDEYFADTFRSAGYGGLDLVQTPIGTRITISVLRPGLVIGRRGSKIKSVSEEVEERFKFNDPVISVVEVQVPEFEPRIMAWQIARSLARGYKYRRVGYWVLRSIREAGARGVEITISGKLRTVRSRFERFTDGILLKSGEVAQRFIKKGKTHVLLKQGIVGIQVAVAPPSPEYEQYIGKAPKKLKEEVKAEVEGEEVKEEEEVTMVEEMIEDSSEETVEDLGEKPEEESEEKSTEE
jgi:small subunit ribosomal protein S3